VAAAAGQYHTVAAKADGTILTWGHNPNGQLGNGTILDSATPLQPFGTASGVSSLCASGSFVPKAAIKVALSSDPADGSDVSIMYVLNTLGFPAAEYSTAQIESGQ